MVAATKWMVATTSDSRNYVKGKGKKGRGDQGGRSRRDSEDLEHPTRHRGTKVLDV